MNFINYVNAEILKKNKKRNNILLIISFIFLIGTGLLIYFGTKTETKDNPEPISMNNLINKENIYSYIKASTKPYLFAAYENNGVEEDNKYYLIMDNDNLLYVVYMNEEQFDKLNIDTIKDNPLKVLGYTKKITNEIKELAIKSYNELMNDEYLTNENFSEYVGYVYLDMSTLMYNYNLYYIGAGISVIMFILVITTYMIIVVKNKKTFKDISNEELANIDAELSGMTNSEYAIINFYILKDYLVDLNSSAIIVKYDNLVWAYPYEKRQNGLLINKYIKIVDKKNKKYKVASTKLIEKDKDEILQEILDKIKEKNKNIIVGTDKESKIKAKEKIKELKKGKVNNKVKV